MNNPYPLLSLAAWLGFALTVPAAEPPPPEVRAPFTADIRLDGKTDEKVWREAEWTMLDRSRPARPANAAEWQNIYAAAGTREYAVEQFDLKVKAAAAWSEQGLYFALAAEDRDVQGRIRQDQQWLWLEDVLEVFIASAPIPTAPTAEIQVNPANAVFINLQSGSHHLPQKTSRAAAAAIRPDTAVAIDGTLNDSSNRDRGWSAELFFSWESLQRAGLAIRPDPKNPTARPVCFIRFAAWDLTIYTQLRLNRFSSPGAANPHHPEHYRPLRCLPPRS